MCLFVRFSLPIFRSWMGWFKKKKKKSLGRLLSLLYITFCVWEKDFFFQGRLWISCLMYWQCSFLNWDQVHIIIYRLVEVPCLAIRLLQCMHPSRKSSLFIGIWYPFLLEQLALTTTLVSLSLSLCVSVSLCLCFSLSLYVGLSVCLCLCLCLHVYIYKRFILCLFHNDVILNK